MNKFTIHRARPDLFPVSDKGANDTRLSWTARGILLYLETKPEEWSIETDDLVAQGPSPREEVVAALQELVACGYLPAQEFDS